MARRRRRKSPRLWNWDYTTSGFYFVTVCVENRKKAFGDVVQDMVVLNSLGTKADKIWRMIPEHHPNVRIDEHVTMPNHIHGIIVLERSNVGTLYTTSLQPSGDVSRDMGQISPAKGSLGVIMRTFKAAVTRWARRNGFPDFTWQARFYDHIVRDETSLEAIRNYVRNNPFTWQEDRFHPND